MATALAFHNTRFNVVNRNNQIWLSSKELAQALKYASTKAVTDIYNKNTDEFSDGMSQVVESTTSGNYRKKVRIFSLRGAHLIAMFARTPVAKEFRRWVLDILDRETGVVYEEPAKAKVRQCTARQLIPLRQTVERLITTGVGQIYPDIWKLVHQRFGVEHIHQLRPEQVSEAVGFLNGLEGEYLARGNPLAQGHFTSADLCALCWVWNAAEYMREHIELIYPALVAAKSEYAPGFYAMASEYRMTLEDGRRILERETQSVIPHPDSAADADWRRVLPRLRRGRL